MALDMAFPDSVDSGERSALDDEGLAAATGEQLEQIKQSLGQGRGVDEEKSQSDDAKDKERTNGGLVKGEDFGRSAKKEIDARDKDKCQNCGKDVRSVQNKKGVPTPPNQRQRHHIHPKSQGGSGAASNGKTLCPACHKEEHRKMREAKKKGQGS